MVVRDREASDTSVLADVFFRSVRLGAGPAYSERERAAWVPQKPDVAAWGARLAGLETLVDEDETGGVTGFMSWRRSDGYVDLAFVVPEAKGTGAADRLYAVVENRARAAGSNRLWSHASHLAKPFFTKHGWIVLSANTVTRQGINLANWEMEKRLKS